LTTCRRCLPLDWVPPNWPDSAPRGKTGGAGRGSTRRNRGGPGLRNWQTAEKSRLSMRPAGQWRRPATHAFGADWFKGTAARAQCAHGSIGGSQSQPKVVGDYPPPTAVGSRVGQGFEQPLAKNQRTVRRGLAGRHACPGRTRRPKADAPSASAPHRRVTVSVILCTYPGDNIGVAR
jgi:hypothetical protein